MKRILSLLVVMLFIAACTTQQNTAQQQNTQDQAAADSGPIAKPATNDAVSKLKNIMTQTVKYKVSYNINAAGQSTQMTQYFSGKNFRTDVMAQGYETRSYMVDGTFTTCNKISGSWTCSQLDTKTGQQQNTAENTQEDIKENIDSYNVEGIGTRTVAGVQADCYRITMEQGTSEYCYSKDYVPLYMKMTFGEYTTEMTATSYSTSVTAADFVLPAEPGEAIDPNDYLKNIPDYS